MAMATRRPLANVPNATNSPHRAGLLPVKRARSNQMEIPYGQPPPKKQVMENTEYETRTTTCQNTNTESKLFARRSNNGNPSAFEKKLVAAREKERQPLVKHVKAEKATADTMDSIRQWQRHYRKAFPQFVFYFDSIPEDVRRRFSRQVIALGAVSYIAPQNFQPVLVCTSCHLSALIEHLPLASSLTHFNAA